MESCWCLFFFPLDKPDARFGYGVNVSLTVNGLESLSSAETTVIIRPRISLPSWASGCMVVEMGERENERVFFPFSLFFSLS